MINSETFSKIAGVGNAYLNDHFIALLQVIPHSVYWKDQSGHYLGANEVFLRNSQMSCEDVIGSSDEDFAWRDLSNKIQENDKKVIATSVTETFFERIKNKDGSIDIYKSRKTPIHASSGKTVGVLGLSIKCTDNILIELISNKDEFKKAMKDSNFKDRLSDFQDLSSRQLECLYYVLRGMTIKEVAHQMNISARTAEQHYDMARIKLNCRLRSEIISKIIESYCGSV